MSDEIILMKTILQKVKFWKKSENYWL